MIYRILADVVLVAHLAFIVFVVLGGLAVRRRRWLAIVHLPSAAYGAAIEHWGWICPLTPLENRLRALAGETGYEGGFVEHHLLPIVYPGPLPPAAGEVLAVAVVVANLLTYAWAFRRRPGGGAMVTDLPELRDRTYVFRDRREAGEVLARMLQGRLPAGARILAIPAGGVPVAVPIAEALGLPLDVAVVSKVTPPWNSEVGYGAVAFDGRVRLDDRARARLGVGEPEAREGVERTRAKVRGRVRSLREGTQAVVAPGDTAVLVDDGLASGFTMTVAIEAVRDAGAGRVIVAVPTGSGSAVERLASSADEVLCANVRTGWSFAVADAYERWSDIDDATVLDLLEQLRRARAPGG